MFKPAPSRHEFVQPAMLADPRAVATEPVQPRHPNPVPGDDGEALSRIAASFRARFPDEWAEWAKCPLEAGLVAMAELMKGKG